MKKVTKNNRQKDSNQTGEYSPVTFSSVKTKWMKEKDFVKVYSTLEPEYSILNSIIEKRIKNNMSQKDLAKKLGTKQSAISRLESGRYNPSLSFLKKLGKALDSELVISFK